MRIKFMVLLLNGMFAKEILLVGIYRTSAEELLIYLNHVGVAFFMSSNFS